jgi:hypothetical protein
MTLFVDRNGQASTALCPVSKMGVMQSQVLGVDLRGFVSVDTARGLIAMYWPRIRHDLHFAAPRLRPPGGTA